MSQFKETFALCTVMIVWGLQPSCTRKVVETRESICYIAILPNDAPVDTLVMRNGAPVSADARIRVDHRLSVRINPDKPTESLQIPANTKSAVICVPPSIWISDPAEWSLERFTPCGSIKTRLLIQSLSRTTEEDMRGAALKDKSPDGLKESFEFTFEEPLKEMSRTNVWYAPPTGKNGQSTITIGKASLVFRTREGVPIEPGGQFISQIECASSHVVSVDGKKIGTIDGATRPKSLIVNQRSECLRETHIVYGVVDPIKPPKDQHGGSTLLHHGPLLALPDVERIDSFLTRAPDSIHNPNASPVTVEILPEECPTKPSRAK